MGHNKSKKIKTINEKTLIVALDIGKKIHYGYFRTPDNQDVKPFQIYNNGHSFKRFWDKLSRFQKKHGLDEVVIGFEPTGPYAEPICNYLRKTPAKLVQVNPMHTKRIKELTGNSPNKTDKKDPRVIADVISLGHSLTVIVPEGSAAHLRRLTHARERAMKQRTAMLNLLQNLVVIVFPEFLSIINPASKTGMHLMRNCPDPKHIVALGIESLGAVLKGISRGRFRKDHAEQLFKAAQDTVGVTEGKESVFMEISHVASTIERQNEFIDSLEKQLLNYLEDIPYSHSILSIKGIGGVTVAGLIGEVGDFTKFKTISEVMKVAGLDLFEISSGMHQGVHHISKRGRALIRKMLYFAAINVVRSYGIMHVKYQKMIDNGMPKKKALIAISRKLLRIIFALARDNAEYDVTYHKEHEIKLAA